MSLCLVTLVTSELSLSSCVVAQTRETPSLSSLLSKKMYIGSVDIGNFEDTRNLDKNSFNFLNSVTATTIFFYVRFAL